jgi:hypothetical protein
VNPVGPLDNSGKHPIPTVPPDTVASPHGIDFGDGPERWWTPGWDDIWRHMGWRWILFLPLVGLIGLSVVYIESPHSTGWLWNFTLIFGKGLVWVIALPFVAAGYAISSAVAARKDPFCIHCGYDLNGLPDHHKCPECGLPYNWTTIEEYRRNPKWFVGRWRERKKHPQTHGAFDAGPVRSPKSRDGT